MRTIAAATAVASSLLLASPALADGTAQTLPFSQNWSNTGLISGSDNWAGVPGVEGFQRTTTGSMADPQTILGPSTTLDVLANQSAATSTTGGVGEFELADPVVGFQGSGTALAPNLVITVSTAGATSVQVSYTLRHLDTDTPAQRVALQYRIGNAGDFTNVASGYVANATAAATTAVAATLPADANNQPLVQVRVITADASGSDAWIGVDDISISGTTAVCGNGSLEGSEACDDGNTSSGDCCSSTCTIESVGTICRVASGTCDVAEVCDGVTGSCPGNVGGSSGTVCRAVAGTCDVAERCDGSPSCPADALLAVGTVCRVSAGSCDVAESCAGAVDCPSDTRMADGASCADGTTCNGTERCMGGTCRAGTTLVCNDGDACTADMCAEPGGCATTPVAGCCNIDSDCSGGTVCLAVSCNTTTNRCQSAVVMGCCDADSDCNDSMTCTRDSCNVPTGVCSNTEIDRCCVADGDCDDGDRCSTDRCTAGTCTATAIAGCCLGDADCREEDGSACTTPSCDVATARCVEDLIDCDDADGCTADACEVDGSCSHTDISCDDGNDCTADSCTADACEHARIDGCVAMDDAGMPIDDAGMGMDAALPDAGFTNDAASLRTDVPVDAGPLGGVDAGLGNTDAGPLDTRRSNCSCHVASPDRTNRSLWLALGLLGLVVARVRRRR